MHVRPHREGVEQAFGHNKAAAMMSPSADTVPSSITTKCEAESDVCHRDTLLRYTLRPDSRSAYFQPAQHVEGGNNLHAAFIALAQELMRRNVFNDLVTRELLPRLQRKTQEEKSNTNNETTSHTTYWLTRQELCELPARWVIQSINQLDTVTAQRTSVTPLDIGSTVRLLAQHSSSQGHTTDNISDACHAINSSDNDTSLYRVVATAEMCNGEYWVDITPCSTNTKSDIRRVMREEVALYPAVEVYPDPLLPCDELHSVRGTSTCLYSTLLTAMQRTHTVEQQQQQVTREDERALKRSRTRREQNNNNGSVNNGRSAVNTSAEDIREATRIVRYIAHATLQHRRLLAARCTALQEVECKEDDKRQCMWLKIRYDADDTVHFCMPRDMTRTCECDELTQHQQQHIKGSNADDDNVVRLEILPRALQKLAAMWDAQERRDKFILRKYTAEEGRESSESVGESASAAVAWLLAQRTTTTTTTTSDSDGWYVIRTSDTTCPQPAFFLRVATLLLRYGSLYGTAGYNQGPHAALPPPLMQCLAQQFDIAAEGFASPLNAQLMRFHSLFIDTDVYFGSMGSFLDVQTYNSSGNNNDKVHLEVNPPFDKAVIARMEQHILRSLQASEKTPLKDTCDSLLYLVVLPSHDHVVDGECADDTNTSGDTRAHTRKSNKTSISTERALCTSAYCLAHVLCAATESAYVDGHQHLLRAPLFCITTATRLIVLGNAKARQRYGDAQARLEAIRCAWRDMTADSRV